MAARRKAVSAKKQRSRPVRSPSVVNVAPREMNRLFERIVDILDQARADVVRAVNSQMILAYWHIGHEIVKTLQGGDERAEYGRRLIEELSLRLTGRYGRGFSTTSLWYFRQFYQCFSDRVPEILHKACGESPAGRRHNKGKQKNREVFQDLALAIEGDSCVRRGFSSALSWSHYRILCQVENRAERLFYEIEAEKEGWSVPQLGRQIHTLLFLRLMKSRDKAGVLALAHEGQAVRTAVDVLKDPYVLDFLGLPDGGRLRESELEAAIISKLQSFLLELGKGFAFVARQQRLAYEDEHFYVDLVFYHTILKCHILIDLKIGKLSHQDIGQMDSYVRVFDDQFASEGDNPTIGLILCAEKNETMARYSVLNESKKIFAAKYMKHLPSEAELKREIERERRQIEAQRATVGESAKKKA